MKSLANLALAASILLAFAGPALSDQEMLLLVGEARMVKVEGLLNAVSENPYVTGPRLVEGGFLLHGNGCGRTVLKVTTQDKGTERFYITVNRDDHKRTMLRMTLMLVMAERTPGKSQIPVEIESNLKTVAKDYGYNRFTIMDRVSIGLNPGQHASLNFWSDRKYTAELGADLTPCSKVRFSLHLFNITWRATAGTECLPVKETLIKNTVLIDRNFRKTVGVFENRYTGKAMVAIASSCSCRCYTCLTCR